MKIRILDFARDDLLDGFHFYEAQVPELGRYFLTCLYSDVESLAIFGGTHSKPYRHYYRALSKRFPFAIYYTINGNTVEIRSVVDCRRKPSWIHRHLDLS